MKLEKLNPNLGVRVTGINLGEVTQADREELRALLDEHLVVFFAEQTLDAKGFLKFGDALGGIEAPEVSAPYQPTLDGELSRISYLEIDSRVPRGRYADVWHTDGSYYEYPSYGPILQPVILPSLGGDTLWASMYAAYDTLSDSLRRSLDDLRAAHIVGSREAVHPVIRVHPITGRRGIFVNRLFTKRIIGLSDSESTHILELLFSHLISPEFQISFRWTSDIVAVWDNRFTQHFAVRDYSERRRMLRLAMAGEKPIGPREYDAQSA